MNWTWKPWSEVTRDELYEALKLRADVFVIEQRCIYPDLDNIDQKSLHLFVRDDAGALVAYLRVVPPGARYTEPSIGRLVAARSARGKGLGRALMLEAIKKCREIHRGRPIRIQAQQYLESFYSSLGFTPISDPYDEEGIMHVDMLLPPAE
jgi:ElaA protein